LWKEFLIFCLKGGKLEAGRREVLVVERINNNLKVIGNINTITIDHSK